MRVHGEQDTVSSPIRPLHGGQELRQRAFGAGRRCWPRRSWLAYRILMGRACRRASVWSLLGEARRVAAVAQRWLAGATPAASGHPTRGPIAIPSQLPKEGKSGPESPVRRELNVWSHPVVMDKPVASHRRSRTTLFDRPNRCSDRPLCRSPGRFHQHAAFRCFPRNLIPHVFYMRSVRRPLPVAPRSPASSLQPP